MFSSFRSLQWIAVLAALVSTSSAKAADIAFTNLSLSDFDSVVKELSGNFAYSSITPASSLGRTWGFEFGAVAGSTKSPQIANFVKAANSSSKFKRLYHADILGRLTVPFGITAEAMFIPKITVSDASMKQFGGAVMWTITDLFFTDWPVTIATKGYLTKTNLGFSQNITGTVSGVSTPNVPATIDYDSTVLGAQLLVSKKLFVFEPYVGIGYAKAQGTLSINTVATTTNFFNFTIPSLSAGVTSKPTSTQFLAGADLQLLFLSLGAEYQRVFGTTSYTGRLSFRF